MPRKRLRLCLETTEAGALAVAVARTDAQNDALEHPAVAKRALHLPECSTMWWVQTHYLRHLSESREPAGSSLSTSDAREPQPHPNCPQRAQTKRPTSRKENDQKDFLALMAEQSERPGSVPGGDARSRKKRNGQRVPWR